MELALWWIIKWIVICSIHKNRRKSPREIRSNEIQNKWPEMDHSKSVCCTIIFIRKSRMAQTDPKYWWTTIYHQHEAFRAGSTFRQWQTPKESIRRAISATFIYCFAPAAVGFTRLVAVATLLSRELPTSGNRLRSTKTKRRLAERTVKRSTRHTSVVIHLQRRQLRRALLDRRWCRRAIFLNLGYWYS